MPKSPCNGICTLGDDRLCIGCLRSGDEIADWPTATTERQREILAVLRKRRERAAVKPRSA